MLCTITKECQQVYKDIEIKVKYALPGIFYLLSGDLICQVNV
jgi:hypothetical protein